MELHDFRDEYLTRTGEVTNPLGHIHRKADHVIWSDLDLTGVYPRSHLKSHAFRRSDDLSRCPHRPRRGVERGEEPVADGFDLTAPVALEAGPDHSVVGVGEGGPLPMSHAGGSLGRGDDVGKQ